MSSKNLSCGPRSVKSPRAKVSFKKSESANLFGDLLGGTLNNIPPSVRHGPLCQGGEDTANLLVAIKWTDAACESLFNELDSLKSAAAEDKAKPQFLVRNGDAWRVAPYGFALGDGNGPKMRWRLCLGGFSIGLQRRQDVTGDNSWNAWLQIGSELLMAVGSLTAAFAHISTKIDQLGGMIRGHLLSRVDPCIDLPGVGVDELSKLYREKKVIKLARKGCEFAAWDGRIYTDGNSDTGFSLGKNILLRVYDKLLECKNQPSKLAIIQATRWGGPVKKACRVEYQLSREPLKSFGVNTVQDWDEKKASILKYLAEEWFRLTVIVPDRKNRNTARAGVAEIWKKVSERFALCFGSKPETGRARRFKNEIVCNPKAALLQAFGCAVVAGVCLGVGFKSVSDVMAAATAAMSTHMNPVTANEKIELRRLEWAAKHPVWAFSQVDKFGVVKEDSL